MKLKLFLKSPARAALEAALVIWLLSSCSSSTTPTYTKEEIAPAIEDICRNEYKMDIKAQLVGETLWIYLPVEGLVQKSDKAEKYTERFSVELLSGEFSQGALNLRYLIKDIPETEKTQEYKYNKAAMDKINSVWRVLRRVMFSVEHTKTPEPKFYSLVISDISNGFELKDISYYLDIKKVSYEYISWSEYQHRSIQDTTYDPRAIGDKEGLHLDYKNITMEEFLASQIQNRIRIKFQKPEVEKNTDIDKEIITIIAYTLKIYEFQDYSAVNLYNLASDNRIILNRAAIWARPID